MSGEDALAGFLALAKSARKGAAASLIADATAAPGVFAFGELLDMPSIKEARPLLPPLRARVCLSCSHALARRPSQLEGTELSPSLALLRVFAYGTVADYNGETRRSLASARRSLTRPALAAASSSLPPLSPAQALKLKQLTVASLAENSSARLRPSPLTSKLS